MNSFVLADASLYPRLDDMWAPVESDVPQGALSVMSAPYWKCQVERLASGCNLFLEMVYST